MQPPFSPHGQMASYNNPPISSGGNTFNVGPGGGGQARLSPHGNLPAFSGSQIHGQANQNFNNSQLSPQSAIGARASPGVGMVSNLQGQSTVGGWNNSLPNRPMLQPQQIGQQQQQQQQQLGQQQQQQPQQHLNFSSVQRGYNPGIRPSMRSLPSPGPPNPGTAARQANFAGMTEGPAPNLGSTPPTSTAAMFNHQQQQQQQQIRLQRTVSAPSGVISGKIC